MSATEILTIGSVIKHRGEYNAETVYYTNNQVTICNCVFQAIGNNFSGVPPIEENSDGTIKLANTATWKCIIDNVKLYNAALSTNDLDDRTAAVEKSLEQISTKTEVYDEFIESKGVANGLTPLDDDLQVPSEYLPNSAFEVLEFQGFVANTSVKDQSVAQPAGVAFDTAAKCFYAYAVGGGGVIGTRTYYKSWGEWLRYKADADGAPYTGKIYIDTTTNTPYRWNGTTMSALTPKQVTLTQEEYDALVDAGTVEADTYYNVIEED